MHNFLSVVGKIFRGLDLFLSIIYHIIWIVIGGAIVVGIIAVMSGGGISQLIQQAIPSIINQQQSSSQGNNQNSGLQSSGTPQFSQQEISCAANILGQTRIQQLTNGSTPTTDEISKIGRCFPQGFQF